MLESLRDTRVGCAADSLARIVPPGEGEESEGVGWAGLTLGCIFSCISFVSFSFFAVLWGVVGAGDQEAPL